MSVRGLESRHSWDGGVVILNKLDTFPRFKATKIEGLTSLGDAEDNRDARQSGIGEIPRRSYRRGKTVVYTGRVEDSTLDGMRAYSDALRAAFANLNDERQMAVVPHPSYPDQSSYFFKARPLIVDIPDEQGSPHNFNHGNRRDAIIGMRLSDSRIYSTQLVSGTTSAPAQGTGTSLPWTLPVTLTASSQPVAPGVVTNPGTAPSPPIIDVYGPVTNPTILNVTLGLQLVFQGLSLANGEYVRIDFAKRTIVRSNGQSVRSALVRSSSTWWKPGAQDGSPGIGPGAQTIQLTSADLALPARADISFYPAYW